MFKSLAFSSFLLSCFLISSCANSTENQKLKPHLLKQKKNKVYSVVDNNGSFMKGKITYLETFEYDEKGNEIGHLIYDVQGNLAGKELTVFDDDKELPVGTRYYTPEDSLLSYYLFEYNDALKSVRKAYDAANDELLRIENFFYDDDKNMIKKEVRNADNQLVSIFEFTYDAHGNETSMTRKNAQGGILLQEEYRIVKRDSEHRWLENWGWSNDKPVSYRTRELIYF